MLVDTERIVYQRYGLPRSVAKSWSPGTLWWYVRRFFDGSYRLGSRLEEDPNQLGGDFVIGPDYKIMLAHPSRTPIDRVSVSELLSVVTDSLQESDFEQRSASQRNPSQENVDCTSCQIRPTADPSGVNADCNS
uniref:Alkyl hydroperoxide reductase subunit C/ Thiol specific antioxidant domain-containing protein n=1 Tax=Timspurckia oligopyrenoides TaxID=708627 RepID=A0A7S0ZAE7_9RHOD|mmetsp:Transcript_10039/g.18094  ORF Transcript_10039/g.18094 Transcript_10039/m.18094 type:complete len:134 (+) Transcript_10039:410-811(+)